jgi:hypothetical protein
VLADEGKHKTLGQLETLGDLAHCQGALDEPICRASSPFGGGRESGHRSRDVQCVTVDDGCRRLVDAVLIVGENEQLSADPLAHLDDLASRLVDLEAIVNLTADREVAVGLPLGVAPPRIQKAGLGIASHEPVPSRCASINAAIW